MESSNKDIKDIKSAMLIHNKSDDERFAAILTKLDIMHDLHIRNGEMIKTIKEDTSKTNGRVTKLEDVVARLDKSYAVMEVSNANLAKIVSSQHNQYDSFVKQQEILSDKKDEVYATKEDLAPVIKILWAVGAIVGTGFLGVIGSALIYYIQNK